MRWLRSHDFIILQETHSGLGKDCKLGWELGGRVKVFNSAHPDKYKTLSTAGVMLIANNSFLDKFDYHYWTEVEKGYVGILNLGGVNGLMQVVAVYSHTTPAERRRLWEKVKGYIDKRAMVVMAGDFNFVMDEDDRFRFNGEVGKAILTKLN